MLVHHLCLSPPQPLIQFQVYRPQQIFVPQALQLGMPLRTPYIVQPVVQPIYLSPQQPSRLVQSCARTAQQPKKPFQHRKFLSNQSGQKTSPLKQITTRGKCTIQPLFQKLTEQSSDAISQDEPNQLEDIAIVYGDGYSYRGQGIKPKMRKGFGVLSDPDGNEAYAGFWDEDKYNGEGRLNNLKQEILDEEIDWGNFKSIGNYWAGYEGDFQNGKMHGKGTLLITNGEKFIGQFQNGMIDGEGEFQTMKGQFIKGKWAKNKIVEM